jgi:hypothetical protein
MAGVMVGIMVVEMVVQLGIGIFLIVYRNRKDMDRRHSKILEEEVGLAGQDEYNLPRAHVRLTQAAPLLKPPAHPSPSFSPLHSPRSPSHSPFVLHVSTTRSAKMRI